MTVHATQLTEFEPFDVTAIKDWRGVRVGDSFAVDSKQTLATILSDSADVFDFANMPRKLCRFLPDVQKETLRLVAELAAKKSDLTAELDREYAALIESL